MRKFDPSRRGFVRDVLLTASIMMVTMKIGANRREPGTAAIDCAPARRPDSPDTLKTVKSGNWSDPAVWGGNIPSSADTPEIATGHNIKFDVKETTVAGVVVNEGGELVFDPSKNVTLLSTANVIIEGLLKMRPSSANVVHLLRFVGINEKSFVGGGMDVLAADIGLWVMGSGSLDLKGTPKTSWTRATGDIPKGSLKISVEQVDGWKNGDEICISPTEPPTVGDAYTQGFEETTVQAISGNSISLSKALVRRHPKVNDRWTAEVMNLTRNVRIEGTANGRSHIFIRSTEKQFIQYTAIRHMGPRKDRNGDGITELVAGRYGMHFHHCNDGSRGSLVKGNVIRDTGNHCYVPHVSHQIYFRDNISYNTLETSFWWDPGDVSNDVVYEHNIVARCNFLPRSMNMNAEDAPTFSSSAFSMTTGDGNICNHNVVVGGAQGDAADGGAYNWETTNREGVWQFIGNIAHNNGCGLRVWQNSTLNHVVEDFTAYHNGTAVFHGAYANSYTYTGGYLYGNTFHVKAASINSNRVRIENMIIDGAGIVDHGVELVHSPLPGAVPVLLRNLNIRNCRVAAVHDSVEPEVHSVDVVQCDISGNIILHPLAGDNEVIRVQQKGGASYLIDKAGKRDIAPFAPEVWGTGRGLKGEYFNNTDFTGDAFTRTDSNISFSEWSSGVHYAITNTSYSVRWTGQIQPQYSEKYVFAVSAGGGYRLYIDNKQVLSNWQEHFPDVFTSSPIELEAGKKYDIRVEYFNMDSNSGAGLSWSSPSQPFEYVPQSQLYSEALASPVEPEGPSDTPPPAQPADTFTVATIARDFIEVRSADSAFYQLYDAHGRLLKKGNVMQGVNQISVYNFASGVLLLKFNHVRSAYKVVKM